MCVWYDPRDWFEKEPDVVWDLDRGVADTPEGQEFAEGYTITPDTSAPSGAVTSGTTRTGGGGPSGGPSGGGYTPPTTPTTQEPTSQEIPEVFQEQPSVFKPDTTSQQLIEKQDQQSQNQEGMDTFFQQQQKAYDEEIGVLRFSGTRNPNLYEDVAKKYDTSLNVYSELLRTGSYGKPEITLLGTGSYGKPEITFKTDIPAGTQFYSGIVAPSLGFTSTDKRETVSGMMPSSELEFTGPRILEFTGPRIEPYETYYGDYITNKPSWKERIMGSFHQFQGSKRMDEPTLFSGWKIDMSGEVAPPLPYETRGTISGMGGGYFKPTLTYGEKYQAEKLASRGHDPIGIVVADIEENLQKKYQEMVTSGTSTLIEAEEGLQKEFEADVGEYQIRRGLALSHKPELDVSKELAIGIKGGLIVGGLTFAPVLTGSVLMGTSGIDVIKGGGLAVGGEGWKERGGGLLRAGLGTAGIIIGGRAAFGTIEKQIVSEQFKELAKQPIKIEALKFQGDKYSVDLVRGTQTYQGLKTEYNILGKVYKVGKSGFVMPEGTGTGITSGKLNWNILSGRTGTDIVSVQKFLLGSKGFGFTMGEGGRLSGVVGKSTFIPQGSTGAFWKEGMGIQSIEKQLARNVKIDTGYTKDFFGGTSYKLEKDYYALKTGKISQVDIRSSKPFIEFGVDPNAMGFMKVIDMRKFGDTGVRFIQGSGKRSSQAYIQSLYSPGTTSVSQELVKKQLGVTTQSLLKSSFDTGSSAVVGGVSTSLKSQLQTKQDMYAPTIKADTEIRADIIQMPKSDLMIKQLTKQKSYSKQKSVVSQMLYSPQKIDVLERTQQLAIPQQRTKLKQKQEQQMKTMFAPTIQSLAPSIPSFKMGFHLPIIPFALPILKGKQKPITKKKKKKKKIRVTRYTPTLTARWLGQTAYKIPKAYFAGASGVIGRPMIVSSKPKRKKKSKGKKR